jgi:GNAT superfamily N-acetyltransferase
MMKTKISSGVGAGGLPPGGGIQIGAPVTHFRSRLVDEPVMEAERDGYVVSSDGGRLDLAAVHAFLSTSYWSPGLPIEVLTKSVAHSMPFGVYRDKEQIGFARVVTDRATFAYLCDVYIEEAHRGRKLGQWLVETIVAHPDLQGLRRFVLITRDAHWLYNRVGFRLLAAPDRYMEIHRPNAYARDSSGSNG